VTPLADGLVDERRRVVGPDHVWTESDRIDENSRDIGPWQTRGAAVVSPATTGEVAKILRIADRAGTPVWTFSGGWNWGYGAAMGLRDGALILLLRRMNRIVEVDEELGFAVIEPGVTQAQLQEYLAEHHPGLWPDCTDSTPRGSVIGNALEHGVGYTPMSDHFGALCGIEAVLADGTVVRSGGGPENTTTWHTHRWGTGPSIDGLFGQSNLGVVTRAGIWLMPTPAKQGLFIVEMDDEAALASTADTMRGLMLSGLMRANVHIVNDVMFSAILGSYPDGLLESGQTVLDDEARAELRRRYNIAPFSMVGGMYGTRGQISDLKRALRKGLGGGARVRFVGPGVARRLPGLVAIWQRQQEGGTVDRLLRRASGASPAKLQATSRVFDLLRGVPGEMVLGFAYFKEQHRPARDLDPARDGAGMIWSPCMLPLRGRDMRAVMDLAKPLYAEHGFDYGNTFITVNPRTAMSLMVIWFDRDDTVESQRALRLQKALYAACQEAGYPQYRTGHSLHESMFADAPGYRHVLRTIKQALDPNDILAPGRYGTSR